MEAYKVTQESERKRNRATRRLHKTMERKLKQGTSEVINTGEENALLRSVSLRFNDGAIGTVVKISGPIESPETETTELIIARDPKDAVFGPQTHYESINDAHFTRKDITPRDNRELAPRHEVDLSDPDQMHWFMEQVLESKAADLQAGIDGVPITASESAEVAHMIRSAEVSTTT